VGEPRDRNYEQIYRGLPWAYGQVPDPELVEAVRELPRGRVLDLGGGQGRHALALAEMGFEVEVVDSAFSGLDQMLAAAGGRGLTVHATVSDIAAYRPRTTIQVVVAALLFHIPPRWLSLGIAETVGRSLAPEGLFYLSLPGYTGQTREFALELLSAANCAPGWVTKHLVTKADRPRLPVPRRNETRALGVRIE
jgi:trans-aconitate methyltransferase